MERFDTWFGMTVIVVLFVVLPILAVMLSRSRFTVWSRPSALVDAWERRPGAGLPEVIQGCFHPPGRVFNLPKSAEAFVRLLDVAPLDIPFEQWAADPHGRERIA